MLQQLLQGTSMADVNRCLKGKRSLLGLLGGDKLGAFCVQLIHMEPWAVVVILQAEIDSQITIGDFSNAFMLCPRDLPCEALVRLVSDKLGTNVKGIFGPEREEVLGCTTLGAVCPENIGPGPIGHRSSR